MSKHLVLLVHGIDSNEKTWSKFKACLDKHPEKKFKKNSSINHEIECDCFYETFGYDSAIFNLTQDNKIVGFYNKITGKIPESDLSIEDHADTLITEIEDYQDKYQKISFIAHSMGGLVVLFALFKIIEEKEELFKKISKTIFFASPFAGSDNISDIESFFGKKKINSKISSELGLGSDTIIKLNNKISKFKETLLSKEFLYIYGIKDGRIAKDSLDIADIFCDLKFTKYGHNDIKEPKNSTNIPFKSCIDFLFDKEKTENTTLKKEHKKNLTNSEIKNGIIKTVQNQRKNKESSIEDVKIENYLKEKWEIAKKANSNHDPFIILSSHYTHTLYSNACYLGYLVYNIKMIENGKLDSFGVQFTPFDKEKLSQEKNASPLCCNENNDRFSSYTIKGKVFPCNISSAEFKQPEHVITSSGDDVVKLSFKSEMISEGTELRLEISISDQINLMDNPISRERRGEYFTFNINNEKSPHGKRFITWQLETFKDNPGEVVFLPYEPHLKLNQKEILNKNNCNQNIFYKRWDWEFSSIDDVKKTSIHLTLNESASHKNGVPCNS